MKKVLAMAALILGVVVSQFVAMPQAQAYDHHVGQWNDGWKAYLMTETISIERRDYMDYRCRVKAVRGSEVIYIDYRFWEDRSKRMIEHFTNSLGHSGMFTISDANGFYIEHNIDDYVSANYYE